MKKESLKIKSFQGEKSEQKSTPANCHAVTNYGERQRDKERRRSRSRPQNVSADYFQQPQNINELTLFTLCERRRKEI